MNKAFIVLGNRFGEKQVLQAYGFSVVETMEDADFVVFTGGEDINPALYGEAVHRSVYFNNRRDEAEIRAYEQAVTLKKPMLGICRGAQLLNVVVGGSLYQDVNHHSGGHAILNDEGESFYTTSVHHQMMRTTDEAIIKAWATGQSTRRRYMGNGDQEVEEQGDHDDPEIVLYPKHRMLLVQGHPEFSASDPIYEQFRQYVFKLLKSL